MSRQMFQNLQQMSGISGLGLGEMDISMCNNNDSSANYAYTIKINAPQGEFTSELPFTQKMLEGDQRKITTKNTFNIDNTGYDINRELFSDDDIREAFNAIDFNGDGALTTEEISFFLKCMDQPHTLEEVQEMVRMVSMDGKKVMIQDFKKIGRGKLPPFAALRQPDPQSKKKQEVLDNIKQSSLTSRDPEDYFEAKDQFDFSLQKFEEERSQREQHHEQISNQLVQENGGMKLRTKKELEMKREQYGHVLMLNVERAIEGLKQLKEQIVQLHEVAEVLSISKGQAHMLFQKPRLSVREVIFEVVLFSPASNLRKIELILNNTKRYELLNLDEWVRILCFMIGVDQREVIRKRLENILRHRKKELSGRFDKYFILQVMTEDYRLFIWL